MRPLCDTFTSAHTVNRATTRQDCAVSRDDLLEACPSTTRSFRTHGPRDAPRQRPPVTTGIARFATDCNGRRNTGGERHHKFGSDHEKCPQIPRRERAGISQVRLEGARSIRLSYGDRILLTFSLSTLALLRRVVRW